MTEALPAPLQQLANRLARQKRHLGKWARRTEVSCYRLYERDISDQPLIIDWYAGDAVCWTYRRTKDETLEAVTAWEQGVLTAIAIGLGIPNDRIWLKRRHRQEDRQEGGQYAPLATRQVIRTVLEGGLRFEINLSDYLDVGLFLDHRPLRARVGLEAAGKDVLNLFSYTGAFSVHAGGGGARSTTSVDLSNTYLDWSRRNLDANGMIGPEHSLIRTDVLGWLRETVPRGRAYDLIVCDPPTFSNSKAFTGTFSIDRDHDSLISDCLSLLRPGGILYFSTNSRNFQPHTVLASGQEITDQTVPEDFRGRRPHRCWRIGG